MNIEERIQRLNGNTVTYSRAGGGAESSILLIKSDANIQLWIWCYWEIKKSNIMKMRMVTWRDQIEKPNLLK